MNDETSDSQPTDAAELLAAKKKKIRKRVLYGYCALMGAYIVGGVLGNGLDIGAVIGRGIIMGIFCLIVYAVMLASSK